MNLYVWKILIIRKTQIQWPYTLLPKFTYMYIYMVIQQYMLTKVFSTNVVSLHRASDTEPKNHQNLWGKPLLKKLDGETQKKLVQTWNFFDLSHFTS